MMWKTNSDENSQTYSQYKHHNTTKDLIGIIPQELFLLYQGAGEGEQVTNILRKIVGFWISFNQDISVISRPAGRGNGSAYGE